MKILGISAYYHDSAAALTDNGRIVAAAQEERFTRVKHDSSFPVNAVKYCLDQACVSINDLDAVVFYDKPMLKFERLLETYYAFVPKGIRSFVTSIPVWLKEKVFLKKAIHDSLKAIEPYNKRKLTLLFTEHHLSHAASAYYPSGFDQAAILTVDGVGEWATASVCKAKGNQIEIIKELRFPHSLGLLYSAFTYFLGFRVNSGEYKLMGLAPYGIPNSENVKKYIDTIYLKLIKLNADGSLWLNQKYFSYATGLRMVSDKKWAKLFGFKHRNPTDEIEQHHCDLAYAIQQVTEDIVLAMAAEAKRITGSENICLAGGVALNCVANGKLLEKKLFENVFIQPAAGDAGGALGAALATHYIYYGNELRKAEIDHMQGSYLGPDYPDTDIVRLAKKYSAKYTHFENFDDLAAHVAQLIDSGNVVGWFQGRIEFGPRALGNRSILGDARNEEMQKKLNLKIKYRESFRPFAPSVLNEYVDEYFELDKPSPYMLLVAQVNKNKLHKLPDNYASLGIKQRLYVSRSDVPAITHVDFSARVQTVHQNTNKRYWTLIDRFRQITGTPLVVNTSFNVRGEPIVCTPDDAYRCFMRTEMDYLVMNNFLFKKTDQPLWDKKDNWKEEFVLD